VQHLAAVFAVGALVLGGCDSRQKLSYVPIGPAELPTDSYQRPPEVPFERGDYVIKLEQMSSFYSVPGEFGYAMNGRDYGFDSLSFIVTETHPHGGPPLHTHPVEEAHIVLSGTMKYALGDQRLTASAPYIARVPAGVPHTFINGGTTPLNVIAVFPGGQLGDTEILGANPLVSE
jgi:mannose-6-phosphate isomerase-like protein (cupin superfamily)